METQSLELPSLSSDIINPLEEPTWDERVLALPEATVFYSRSWCEVLRESYGFTPCYFVANDSHRIAMVLPMVEVDSKLTGRRGVALPFTDQLSILGSPADARACFERVKQHGKQRRWKYVEIKGKCEVIPEAVPAVAFWGHRLSLNRSPESLFSALSSSTRRAIRKAQQNDIHVEHSSSIQALNEYYALHCLTRKRHGQPPQPRSFFASIHGRMLAQNRGLVTLARVRGHAVAGAVFFHFGKNVVYKFAASDFNHQHLRPNNLVLWETIKWLCCNGFETLDLGKTSLLNPGLRNFKLGFGTQEYPIEYLRFNLQKDRFTQCSDGTAGLPSRVFKLMPSILLRMVGHVLYRHVA